MTHYDRARAVIPGGALTRSKMPGRFYPLGAGPHYAVSGHGAMLRTDEGYELIDMLCGLGAISLGYGVALSAASSAVEQGGTYSLPSVYEARAGEAVLQHVAPWAQRVRFVKTGSEATHAAYRIAKAATGRSLVVVLDGSYHGWHEWSWRGQDGVPDSPYTVLAPYGVDLRDWLDGGCYATNEIAAVFIEPHRWQPTPPAWLRGVQAFCADVGALFVVDEMIYGGRWALGGASEFFDLQPDLACFGKALGNGMAIGAVVGSADLLETHGGMVSGTFSGDTVGLAAVCEVVDFYQRHDVIAHLWERGAQLARGLTAACAAHPALGGVVEGAAPVHQRLRFADPAIGPRFSAQMVVRDVLWLPDCANLSWSHTRPIIDRVVQAAEDSMAALEREGV